MLRVSAYFPTHLSKYAISKYLKLTLQVNVAPFFEFYIFLIINEGKHFSLHLLSICTSFSNTLTVYTPAHFSIGWSFIENQVSLKCET